ncbi:MAG: hypothetical protein Kow00114_24040 [Kiloniellaceae bacterium]
MRSLAALSVVGLLALVLLTSLNGGGKLVAGLLPGSERYEVLVNTNTGQPVTLEMVQRDVQWHRDTARKLRELD